jgi:hypothetical protein
MPALTNSGAPFLSRLPLFADVSPETQANPAIGLTFASVLRAFLRQEVTSVVSADI